MEKVWLSWSPDQLLWATRGRSWGFRILMPASVTGVSPLSIYEAVFGAINASTPVQESQPQFVRADMVDARGVDFRVMAARFLDPDMTCCDESGRRIPHEIMLVGKKNSMPDPRTAPPDWHLQIFRHLAPLYRELYRLESSDQVVVTTESIGPSDIRKDGSSSMAIWIDAGTVLREKHPVCHIISQGMIARCGLGRRRVSAFLVLMLAVALIIAVIVPTAPNPWASGGDQRIVARWNAVLRELVNAGLLVPQSEQAYLVSHLGYLWTDFMNVQQQINERTLQRFRFLKHLYERTRGSEFTTVPYQEIAQAVGLSEEAVTDTFRYLAQEGLVLGSDKGAHLTHAGVVEIETALSHSDRPTEHFPVNIIHIGQVSNSQIQQGTVGSTQSGAFGSLDLAALTELIRELKSLLPQFGLTGDDQAEVQSDITTIETQLSSPRPKETIIKEALRSIKNIAEGAAGGLAASGIVAGIANLLGM